MAYPGQIIEEHNISKESRVIVTKDIIYTGITKIIIEKAHKEGFCNLNFWNEKGLVQGVPWKRGFKIKEVNNLFGKDYIVEIKEE